MEKQIPQLKKKFLKFSDYAGKTIEEIFSAQELAKASVLTVEQTQTCAFLNDGKGHFDMKALPVRAQFSPVFSILAEDLDGDGLMDLFLGGNFYGLKPQTGRLDASYGTVLMGKKGGDFSWAEPLHTGLFLQGEARAIASVQSAGGGNCIIVAMNNQPLYVFQRNRKRDK
jgi:hypothetical protein